MKSLLRKYLSIAALAAAALLVTACEDPSNVGIGLVGDEGGQPVVRDLPPSDLRSQPLDRTATSARRLLVGLVGDPLLGSIESETYVDFSSSTSSGFRSGTVASAELRLRPDYVFGDTTSLIRVAVREIEEAWSPTGLPPDTSFSVGPVITEFSFRPTDTLVVVPMPEAWIEARESVLRSQDFGTQFHGFRLEPVEGNAVVGFSFASSLLRARTQSDSASFAPSGVYLPARRSTEPMLPPSRLLLQAGAGPAAAFTISIIPDNIPPSAVNNVVLSFTADTLALRELSTAGFVRPEINALDLIVLTTDGVRLLLDRSEITDGRFVFRSQALATEVQRILFGERIIEHFELRVPVVPDPQSPLRLLSSTINAVVLVDTSAGEHAPEGFITITPLDE